MPQPSLEAAKHAEIKKRYAWQARQHAIKNGNLRSKPTLQTLRVVELEGLYRRRFGKFVPDTEEGRTALRHICQHLAHYRGDVVSNIMGWIRARAPWFEPDAARTFANQFTAREPLPTAEQLGRLIQLTDAERTELKIKTIRAFDVTKAEMDRRRKAADKQYQQEKRRKAGAKPRSESYSQTEPWVFFGIKRRRTWERRGKPIPPPRDANSSAVDRGTTITEDETASDRVQPLAPSGRASPGAVRGRDPALLPTSTVGAAPRAPLPGARGLLHCEAKLSRRPSSVPAPPAQEQSANAPRETPGPAP